MIVAGRSRTLRDSIYVELAGASHHLCWPLVGDHRFGNRELIQGGVTDQQ